MHFLFSSQCAPLIERHLHCANIETNKQFERLLRANLPIGKKSLRHRLVVWGALFQFMRIIWQTVQFRSPFAVAGSFSSELCEIWPDGSFGRSLTQSGLSVTTDEMHNRPNELVIELVIEPQWLKVWKFHRESIRALNSERCECGEFGELRHMHLLLFTQAGHCWATKWIRFLFQWPTRLRISPTFCWYNLPFVLLPKWPNHLVLAVWA